MTADNVNEREEQALDALIVAALRTDLEREAALSDSGSAEPQLSAADRQALEALGPDLVAQLLRRPARPRRPRGAKGRDGATGRDRGLTGSLHRSDEPGELTDRAREEMEHKVRELEELEGNGEGEEGERP